MGDGRLSRDRRQGRDNAEEDRMKIALGADGAGKPLLDVIEAHLKTNPSLEVTNMSRPGFYADISAAVAHAVRDGEYDRAILCCGTGIGVCISANKIPGIRA